MRKKETQALIKSPTGKGVPLKLNARLEKSECLPTRAPIRGVSKSLVNAATTPPKAAPITTPTAISTTLPRRMNFLKPSSIEELLQVKIGGKCTTGRGEGQAGRPRGSGQFQNWPTTALGPDL